MTMHGIELDTGGTVMNNSDTVPALVEFTVLIGETDINQ